MTHDHDKPHDGPTVEMPKPTIWPMVLSLGLTLIAAGVAFGPAYFAVGGLLFVVALVAWFGELMPGEGHEHEPVTAAAAPIEARPGTVEQLVPGAVGYRFRLPEKMHPVSSGLKGGLVGGLVMPIPALAWGLLSGHGLWFPVNLLAGTVLPGVDSNMTEDQLKAFSPLLLAIGVVMHVAMSATIGLAYWVVLPTLPISTVRGQIIAGGVVLPLIWTGFSYGLMGVANPAMQHYVDWTWFAASQFVFGMAAAIVVVRSETVVVPPAGRGVPPAALLLFALLPLAGGCTPPGKPVLANEPKPSFAVNDFGTLFATNCAGCHGANGNLGPAPPLNDPLFLATVPDDVLLQVVTEGRPGTPMPPFAKPKGGPLSEEQVKVLAAGLKRHWPPMPPVYVKTPPYSAPLGDAKRGEAVFAKACAGCHGDLGQGGTFEKQPVGAINAPAFLALASDQMLRRTVIYGRADLGMPRFNEPTGRTPGFQALGDQDVSDVVALLASWRKPGLK
jgi:mono/diheme cytochrome c family protein